MKSITLIDNPSTSEGLSYRENKLIDNLYLLLK